jgi:hypothetical protein
MDRDYASARNNKIVVEAQNLLGCTAMFLIEC